MTDLDNGDCGCCEECGEEVLKDRKVYSDGEEAQCTECKTLYLVSFGQEGGHIVKKEEGHD